MRQLNIYNRHSIRLENYNYSKGGIYFITICTRHRECILSEVVNGKVILSTYGKIVEQEILNTEKIRSNTKIHQYIIMPNHIHMIIELTTVGVAWYATQNKIEKSKMLISKIIQQLKTVIVKSANRYNLISRVAYHATPIVATKLLRTYNTWRKRIF